MADPLHQVTELLHAHGLRVTAPRVAVLDILRSAPGHPDAEEVRSAVARRLGSVSTQAVYDSLHALTDAGLLRCIEPAGHPARYESRVDDNHHHMICRACGMTRDVDCATSHAPCMVPAATDDFTVDEAEVVFWGLCAGCRHEPTTEGAA